MKRCSTPGLACRNGCTKPGTLCASSAPCVRTQRNGSGKGNHQTNSTRVPDSQRPLTGEQTISPAATKISSCKRVKKHSSGHTSCCNSRGGAQPGGGCWEGLRPWQHSPVPGCSASCSEA